ncbi:integrase [Gemmobacter tilapiae]|uniref:Integrase n=2 Tax=Neogemmobacter tilapiae TaxID=875041 RepID=A0A918TFC9_9RHOB|nr:integrase [Gemmobacter tilapiae]
MIGGNRRAIGLGPYPEISLATARDKARDAKAKVEQGVDPIEDRKAARAALAAANARTLLFSDAVDKWIIAKMTDRPEKSQRAIRSTISRYALPEIGALSVQDITVQDVTRAIQGVWSDKPDTGQKLRSYLEGILSWATVAGHRSGDNPARWNGNLKELLPAPSQVEKGKVGNFPALALADVPAWWAELSKRDSMGAMALRFAALCASRSGEVRGATWDEIDMKAGVWTIPSSRMKMDKEHRVPLSPAAVALLKMVPKMKDQPLVFPSITGRTMSDMTLSKVMRDMQEREEKAGRPGWIDPRTGRPAVPHGLRSSFRDWAAETGYDRDMAEIALAHKVGSDVERAYRRTDLLERRRAMMGAWADFLTGKDSGVVVKFPTYISASD